VPSGGYVSAAEQVEPGRAIVLNATVPQGGHAVPERSAGRRLKKNSVAAYDY